MAEAAQAVLTGTVTALAEAGTTVVDGCALVGLPRSTYYRRHRGYQHYQPVSEPTPHLERPQPAALSPIERAAIIEVLTAEEFADLSVVQTYWSAFDTGKVVCSQRTFYRVAKTEGLVGDRRRTRPHGSRSRRAPAAIATRVGDLWSWDVTELRGPGGRDKYYLYLIIDVFSRYPVGWCIEYHQSKERAVALFADAITAHGVPKVIHSDNGSMMRSEVLVEALVTAGAVLSFSRPRVSDDNPFSESLFKTIKYAIDCPDRFDDIGHARHWTGGFLHGYATEHRHSGLSRHTPASVHYGTADQIREHRQQALDDYWTRHPERFRRRPTAPEPPQQTGINTHLLSQPG